VGCAGLRGRGGHRGQVRGSSIFRPSFLKGKEEEAEGSGVRRSSWRASDISGGVFFGLRTCGGRRADGTRKAKKAMRTARLQLILKKVVNVGFS